MDELKNYFKKDDLAASVWSTKYKDEGEITPDDMHWRLAKAFAKKEFEYLKKLDKNKVKTLSYEGQKYIAEVMDLNLQELEMYFYLLFKYFKYIVPQGSIMEILGTAKIASLSNCVVIASSYDSYSGIMYSDTQLTALFKRRCGVGQDLSNLRPTNTKVNNAAKTTSGVVSFAERFSNTTREVAQSGRK